MKIGVYYYPEQWPREQWERDFNRIASMGLQIVHMGEFAWFTMEPKPGEFQFDWLSECVEMARKRKLEVILCTPTAAPPVWLIEAHPEILPVDETGRRERFGGRRHYTPTAPALHEAATRIVTALADRFGNDPSVIGWQIDNEFSATFFDQSEATHTAFREWLRGKYESIDALNKAWGNQFWNQYYTDFSQILFPPSRDPKYGNPHQHLDASRFWSRAFAKFNKLQANILRPRIGERFITTNFMPMHADVNPRDLAKELTLTSWDAYPVTGWVKDPHDETHRIADPAHIGFTNEQMASYQNRWALMELQPGHLNWSGSSVLPYPGAIRLWIWHAFAQGAEFVTTYRFRQSRFGIEMFHDGLIGWDGVTPSPGGREFSQAIDEMRRLDLKKVGPPVEDYDLAQTVGLVMDFDQLWEFLTLPQHKQWNYQKWLQRWYASATRLGLRVRMLHPGQKWPESLKMIVAPSLQMVSDADVKQLSDYAASGGHLVLTCRTALMDRNGQMFETRMGGPILHLIGGQIEAYDNLPLDTRGKVSMDDETYDWSVWGDLLYAEPRTRVLAKYADQFYHGAAAVIQSKFQKGTVTYCGVKGESSFINALTEKLAKQSGLKTGVLPERVQVIRRGAYRVLLNYQDKRVTAPAPSNARFIVGARQVDPAGVAVWME